MEALTSPDSEGPKDGGPRPRPGLEGIYYVEDKMLEMEASLDQEEELADVMSDMREWRSGCPEIASAAFIIVSHLVDRCLS